MDLEQRRIVAQIRTMLHVGARFEFVAQTETPRPEQLGARTVVRHLTQGIMCVKDGGEKAFLPVGCPMVVRYELTEDGFALYLSGGLVGLIRTQFRVLP
jgi:hypothetical protein